MVKLIQWTPEQLAQLGLQQVRNIRENAAKHQNANVMELCDAEISRRTPQRPVKGSGDRKRQAQEGVNVTGFHFICENSAGVCENPDGTFWTGSWVVSAEHAKRGKDIGAYVALHEAKATPSYRQGTIKDWRKAARDRGKIEDGVEFLIQPTDTPLEWVGRGAAEKGYARGPKPPGANAA